MTEEAQTKRTGPIQVLMIEDDPDDALLFREILAETPGAFRVTHADRLGEAPLSEEAEFDVLLLDLNLPDSSGLETFDRVYEKNPETPIIVFSGLDDEEIAVGAVRRGAQDYLIKGDVGNALLVRSIRYAIERASMLRELEKTRDKERHALEAQSFARIAAGPAASVTAEMYGLKSLREILPVQFRALSERYKKLVDLAVERRVYKVNHDLSGEIGRLGEELASLHAGPRDIVQVHSEALSEACRDCSPERARLIENETRFLLLELMGNALSYYRRYSLSTLNHPGLRERNAGRSRGATTGEVNRG